MLTMRLLRAHRRLTSWIAALAVLLAALAPALSHALGSSPGEGWVLVCTAQGAKWVQPGDDNAPVTGPSVEHCPLCTLHTPTIGMPPAPPAVLPVVDAAAFVPPAFLAAPRTLHAWASAQPRAPPALS
jgi:hypothetical protein